MVLPAAILVSMLVGRESVTWRGLSQSAKDQYTWEHFKAEFGKHYATPVEEDFRRARFQANLRDIAAQNRRFRSGASSWSAGVSALSDLAASELPKGYVRVRPSSESLFIRSSNFTPPTSIDWRQKSCGSGKCVTPVKNQGPCGSCWAFSATETIESAVAIATGKLVELPPQELVDCVTNPDDCGGSGGCGGATQELGFAYAMLNGMAAAAFYPYKAKDGQCKMGTNGLSPRAGITGYVKLPPNDNEALLEAVATVGPVAITVDADWHNYESGVYDGCNSNSSTIDHGVQVVGYGTDPTGGGPYWIVRNSWGGDWGDSGYIKLKRYIGQPACQTDPDSQSGSGCKTSPKVIKVCGECGMLSDSSYPTGAFLFN